jgi:hypothetical protein
MALLTCRVDFIEKFSAALGFISGVMASLSGPFVNLTWWHCLMPFGLNVNVSSFLLMLSFMIPVQHQSWLWWCSGIATQE